MYTNYLARFAYKMISGSNKLGNFSLELCQIQIFHRNNLELIYILNLSATH